jgi:hypothetical protein
MTGIHRKHVIGPGHRIRIATRPFGIVVFWLAGIQAAWAAGGAVGEKIINVADTRAMSPGIAKWIADIYNSSYWEFGILVVVIMAVMGVILGYACEKLMGLSGINLGKMQHHE